MKFWRNSSFALSLLFFGMAAGGHLYYRAYWADYKYILLTVPSLVPGETKEALLKAEFDTSYVVSVQIAKHKPDTVAYAKCLTQNKKNSARLSVCQREFPDSGVEWEVTDGTGYSRVCKRFDENCLLRPRDDRYEIGRFPAIKDRIYSIRIRRAGDVVTPPSVSVSVGLDEKTNKGLIASGQLAGFAWLASIALGVVFALLTGFFHWRRQISLRREFENETAGRA